MVQRRRLGPHALALATAFLDEVRLVGDRAGLEILLDRACRDLGFSHFALVHHADLARPAPGLIGLDNYPEAWRRRFIDGSLYAVDPIQQASARTAMGFRWSQVPDMIRLDARQREILAQGAAAGLADGYTVPVHVPGERSGSCSFASPSGSPIAPESLAAAQLVGTAAFHAARRLSEAARPPTERIRLSPRQRECVTLVAQGKTDWEIARILGLSEETVTKYVNAARERHNVARRIQLAIGAIHDGEISFAEVLHRQ